MRCVRCIGLMLLLWLSHWSLAAQGPEYPCKHPILGGYSASSLGLTGPVAQVMTWRSEMEVVFARYTPTDDYKILEEMLFDGEGCIVYHSEYAASDDASSEKRLIQQNCFRVHPVCFDEASRTLRQSRFDDEGELVEQTTFTLSDELEAPYIYHKSVTTYGELRRTVNSSYNAYGRLTETRSYTLQGRLRRAFELESRMRYFYDSEQNLVQSASYSDESDTPDWCEYSVLDDFGKPLNTKHYRILGIAGENPLAERDACEFVLDFDYQLERDIHYHYHYYNLGNTLNAGRRLYEENHFDAKGTLLLKKRYHYNDTGRINIGVLTHAISYDGTGKAIARSDYRYDQAGRCISAEDHDIVNGRRQTLFSERYRYHDNDQLAEHTKEVFGEDRYKEVQRFNEAGRLIDNEAYSEMQGLFMIGRNFRLEANQSYHIGDYGHVVLEQHFQGRRLLSQTRYFYTALDSAGNWLARQEGQTVRKFDEEFFEPQFIQIRQICFFTPSSEQSCISGHSTLD